MMRKVGELPKVGTGKEKDREERVSLEKESKNTRRKSKLRESSVVGYEAEEGTGRRKEIKFGF